VGWGYITPAPEWLLCCSQCVTPESGYLWPTYEWPDLTPQPSATGTPQPTQTLEYPLGLSLQHIYEPGGSGGGLLNSGQYYEHCINADVDPWPKISLNNLAGESAVPVTWGVDFSWYGLHNGASYDPYDVTNYMRFYNYWGTNCFIDIVDGKHAGQSFWLTEYHEYIDLPILHTYSHKEDFSFNEYDRINITCDTSTDNGYELEITLRLHQLTDSWSMYTGTIWYPFDIGERPPEEPLPTPTGTQIADSDYCAVVIPDSEVEQDLPIPRIGDPVCASLGGFGIGMAWFNTLFGTSVNDLVIPGIEFCFIPIEFGDLNLFGIEIDMDLIALGMASILIFRIILRS